MHPGEEYKEKGSGNPQTAAWLAAGSYLLIALFALRKLAPDPTRLLLSVDLGGAYGPIAISDQRMVLGTVIHAARGWLQPGHDLMGDGACFPTPQAWTLGEHMFGPGLLAALPLAVTGEPILAYNVMVLLTLWVPAIGGFLLARHLVGNSAAAFLAGLLIGFDWPRLEDTSHPYVHGDLWVPLALLCLHKAFTRGGWRPAIGLGLCTVLTLLESYYAILGALVVLGTVTVGLVWQNGVRGLRRAAPALFAVVAAGGITAWLVLAPYLETAEIWQTARTEVSSGFGLWSWILPGGGTFPGFVLTLAGLVGLGGYALLSRGERRSDPRLIYLLAAGLVWWCSVFFLPLGFGFQVPSPLTWAMDWIPGLDAVRVLASVGLAKTVPLAILAAFGFRALFRRLPQAAAALCLVLLSLGILAQRMHPTASEFARGISHDIAAMRLGPSDEAARVLAQAEGPTLILPLGNRNVVGASIGVMWSAWTAQPVSSCYNSLSTGINATLATLVNRLPRAAAVNALATIGFRNLAVDRERLPIRWQERLLGKAGDPPPEGLRLRAQGDSVELWSLPAAAPSTSDWSVLQPVSIPLPEEFEADSGPKTLRLATRNTSATTFAVPRPLQPIPFRVVVTDRRNWTKTESPLRALPLLAVGPRDESRLEIEISTDLAEGNYRVDLFAPDADRPLASRTLIIRPPAQDRLETLPDGLHG